MNRAEIFFADKAILIEGDTERILLPAMMQKIDNEGSGLSGQPLLSQNISIIEVGAYAHVFAELLAFLEIKTLIITDLDYGTNDNGIVKSCEWEKADIISNAAIKYFIGETKLEKIDDLSQKPILFKYNQKSSIWKMNDNGNLRLVFQKEYIDMGYHPRSFEDDFLCVNMKFVQDNKDNFSSLKNKEQLNPTNSYYNMAKNCIKSKTAFALDILMYGDEQNSDWEVPQYIKEGLQWLKQ